MITGYIVFRLPTPPRISWFTNITLWLLSVGILLALVFGTWNGVLNIPLTAMYVSLGHTGKCRSSGTSVIPNFVQRVTISGDFGSKANKKI